MANVKTQGTELFFVDRSGTAALVKMTAPTGIQGLMTGSRDQIETTDLDDTTDKTFIAGLGNPSQITVPFVLETDAASAHRKLVTLKGTGEMVDWIACLSETATDPTLTLGEITAPTTRTSFVFEAFVADLSIDVATNEVVRGTLVLQRSGAVTVTWPA